MESEEELVDLLPMIFMLTKFDQDAAQNATSDEARIRLKMIKHYVRALQGDEGVNGAVKDLLLKFGIDPSLPYAVVGGFPGIIDILHGLHECNGRKCVLKLKKRQARRMESLKKKEAKAKKADFPKGVKAGTKKGTKAAKKDVQKGDKAGRTKAAAKTETARKKVGKGPGRKKAPKAEVAGTFSKVGKVSTSESEGSCKEFPLHYI